MTQRGVTIYDVNSDTFRPVQQRDVDLMNVWVNAYARIRDLVETNDVSMESVERVHREVLRDAGLAERVIN